MLHSFSWTLHLFRTLNRRWVCFDDDWLPWAFLEMKKGIEYIFWGQRNRILLFSNLSIFYIGFRVEVKSICTCNCTICKYNRDLSHGCYFREEFTKLFKDEDWIRVDQKGFETWKYMSEGVSHFEIVVGLTCFYGLCNCIVLNLIIRYFVFVWT